MVSEAFSERSGTVNGIASATDMGLSKGEMACIIKKSDGCINE